MPTRASRRIAKGSLIYRRGEMPGSFLVVEAGVVRSYSVSDNGDEKTIALYAPGDCLPLECVCGKSAVVLFYYQAVTVVSLAESTADDLPDVAGHYVSALLHIQALSQTRAYDKILHIMQFLVLRFGEQLITGPYTKIHVPLTQHDIAHLTGLTRETTVHELAKLKRAGVISVKKKYYFVYTSKLFGDDLGLMRLE